VVYACILQTMQCRMLPVLCWGGGRKVDDDGWASGPVRKQSLDSEGVLAEVKCGYNAPNNSVTVGS
jgi:hypothetical protein